MFHNNRLRDLYYLLILFLFGNGLVYGQKFSADNWQIKLEIANQSFGATLYFGIHPDASDSFDVAIDQAAPPPAFGFYAAFKIESFPGWLNADIRSASDSSHTWQLVISNTGATPSTICWEIEQALKDSLSGARFMINETDMLSDTCLSITGDQIVNIVFKKLTLSEIAHGDFQADSPEEYHLFQNYPNPFKIESGGSPSGTMIRFQVPEKNQFILQIYSLLGRKIKTLYEGEMRGGVHQIEWHGEDESGGKVSQGIYLCLLRSANFKVTRKILLMR